MMVLPASSQVMVPRAQAVNVNTGSDSYVVTESGTSQPSLIAQGKRTILYNFTWVDPQQLIVDPSGNYIIPEFGNQTTAAISKVTPTGVRTVLYKFGINAGPCCVQIDSSGNYIVTEHVTNLLTKITPSGKRTVIYNFTSGANAGKGGGLNGFVIDSSGNYIVPEDETSTLSKITPAGVRTEIYKFSAGAGLCGVAIDSDGNYIVTELHVNTLSKVTPGGVRTIIYKWPGGIDAVAPIEVVIDSDGNYIVTENYGEALVKITPTGNLTMIYKYRPVEATRFDYYTSLNGVAIISTPTPTPTPTATPSTSGGGVPGYPLASIFIGVCLSLACLWLYSRKPRRGRIQLR